jgi:hypothetical protein
VKVWVPVGLGLRGFEVGDCVGALFGAVPVGLGL